MADLERDNARLKRQLKSTKAALVTTISKGDESDLSEDKGSSSFNAALVLVLERYPSLHSGIVLSHTTKALDLRKVVLIDSQTTHDVFCNDKYLESKPSGKEGPTSWHKWRRDVHLQRS